MRGQSSRSPQHDEMMRLCVKVPVLSWFDDMSDRELLNLIPFFEALADIDDVYAFLGTTDHLPDQAVATTANLPLLNVDYHLPNHISTAASSITSPPPPPPSTTVHLPDHASTMANPPLSNTNYQLPNHTGMVAGPPPPTTDDQLPDDVSTTANPASLSPGPDDELSNHVSAMESQPTSAGDDCGQIDNDNNEASTMTKDIVDQEE